MITNFKKLFEILIGGEVAGGGSYEDLYPAIVRKQFFGDELQCLNLEKLFATKRAVGRPKDFEVIAELESLREEQDRFQ